MEIGVFGGTFNPIHIGHLIVAEKIREYFKLERIYFVPSAIPPHKKESIINGVHRLKMVCLAVDSNPYFYPSSVEVDRGGKSYTIDTIRELLHNLGDEQRLYFIIGADAFKDIRTWKDYEMLLMICKFIVISRPGISLESTQKGVTEILNELNLTSTNIKEAEAFNKTSPLDVNVIFFPVPLIDISSTKIRETVMGGNSIRYQVPEAVEHYIITNRIYRK